MSRQVLRAGGDTNPLETSAIPQPAVFSNASTRKEGRMRRFTTAIPAAALVLGVALSLGGGTAKALTPGYDSAYQFESAFLSLKAGDSGTFSVFFANTGSTSWVAGPGTQVNLGACAADKVTCNAASPTAAGTGTGGWLSAPAS